MSEMGILRQDVLHAANGGRLRDAPSWRTSIGLFAEL
jgi:hypothetical protein